MVLIFSGIYFFTKIPRELIDEILVQSPVNMICSFVFMGCGLVIIGMSLAPKENIRTFDEVKNPFIVKIICGERNEFARLDIKDYGEGFVKMTTTMGTPINLPNFRVGQHYFPHNGEWVPGYEMDDAE